MSMLSELQGSKHIRPLDGRAPSVASTIASYDPQEGDNGLVLLAKLLKRVAAGILLQALPTGTNSIGSTKDGGTAYTTSLGVSGARITSADQSAAVASITDAPTSGQKIVVDDILFSSDTALRLDFSEETTGTILFSVYLSAGSSGQFTPRGKLKLATADKKLQWRASAAGNIAVTPLYHSEA
jgi:hypothetical protein